MTDETRSHHETPEPDARIGELLRRHAGLYHDPPSTPRDAMWERIEAERRGGDDGARGQVTPLSPRRWWFGALAVAAVLALGIALGRISMRQEAERQGPAGRPVAEAPAAREREGTASPIEEPGAETPGAVTSPPGALAIVPDEAEARGPARTAPATDRGTPAARPPAAAGDLYRLASQQMLGQAEALLLQYRTDRAADRIDPAIGRWARDVLTSTRLLLDSPAAEDPGMRALLEDLELVLAQIVQRSGEADPLDDRMIDRTIEERDLMPRIRGAIPTGVGAI